MHCGVLSEEVDLNLSDEQMDVIVQLLQHDSLLIKAKTGKIIASLAKDDRFRQRSVDKKIAPLLCNLIKNQMKEKSGVYVILHSCRALGNLCYENGIFLNVIFNILQSCLRIKLNFVINLLF